MASRQPPTEAEAVFWELIDALRLEDSRVEEGTIMGGRCARVAGEFLALVDYKGSGLVVKLPRARVNELIESGVGRAFAPAGKVFGEWVSIPEIDRGRWRSLIMEGIVFVAPRP
jgi:hypothetical protein